MKTELVDVSQTRKEIKIEIEADAVKEAFDRISGQYAKHAKVPGFRPGHAPTSVVRTRFRDDIRAEVLRELVPNAVNEAINSYNLSVIGEPDVHLDENEGLEKFGTAPISLHTHVEVLPTVELGDYKGIEATRMLRPVGEEDVDRVVEGLRESSASLQPVEDRGAELGDTVTVSFQGIFVNEPEAEPIKVDDVEVELGGANVQQEFTDNLLGVKPDEEKTFTVDYPEDFSSKGLAGKKVEYHAKVTAVGRKELPELNDDFARSINEEFDSVATLRSKIREDLDARSKHESDVRLRNDVIGKLVEAHQFDVPQTLVEHQTRHNMQTWLRNMMDQGFDPRNQELDWQKISERMKTQSENDLRASLILETVADKENIDVTPEEVEAEIQSFIRDSRQPEAQVRAALTKEGGERSIADRLRNRKALDMLVENARVTEKEWREEEPESAPVAEESSNDQSASAEGGKA